MKHLVRLIALVCIATLADHGLSSSARADEVAAPRQEVIYITTDDGWRLPAILMTPATGLNPHTPGIVFHHGGAGGHPVRSVGAPRWAAEYLAARGYTTLSILSRHSSGPNRAYMGAAFNIATQDIKAAVDWLADLGAPKIILAGHSLGSIRITRYMVETEDSRINAMVHFAPTRNMPDWMRIGMGEANYLAFMDEMAQMVSEGRGKEVVAQFYDMPPPAPAGIVLTNMHTAETWLNWWGPAAQTRNSVWLKEIKVPVFLSAGSKDGFVDKAWLDEVADAARAQSPEVEVKWYDGADHVYSGFQAEASEDVRQWLLELDLGARPAIRTRLVDSVSTDGRPLSGIVYEPMDGDVSGPGYFTMYGYSGDIMWSSNHWLCVRLAQAGRRCVAGQTRGANQSIVRQTLESEMPDIAGWVDFLEREGHSKVVLEGHSWGGIRITRYKVSTDDPRVAGLVYLAPTRNAPDNLKQSMGDEAYEAVVAEAEGLVAQGRGATAMVTARYEMMPPAPPGVQIMRPQIAASFLSHWGPDANTTHTDQIRDVKVPILAITGSKDVFVDEDFQKRFVHAAGGPADNVWYDDGAPHSLVGWEDRVAADILAWEAVRLR